MEYQIGKFGKETEKAAQKGEEDPAPLPAGRLPAGRRLFPGRPSPGDRRHGDGKRSAESTEGSLAAQSLKPKYV